jgi:hypothetical protein
MGVFDTYKSSILASDRELERNTGYTGKYTTRPVQTKDQIMAGAGLSIAKPRGISTLAGNITTPFVPPVPKMLLATNQGTNPAGNPVDNAWTRTAQLAKQPLSPPAAVVPPVPDVTKLSTITAPPAAPSTAPAGTVAAPTDNKLWLASSDSGDASTGTVKTPVLAAGAKSIKNINGPATGGFAISEENRLKEVALQAGRQQEMNQVIDRGKLRDTNDSVDIWKSKVNRATTPFELAQAKEGLAGAQAQLTTAAGADTHKYTADQLLAGHKMTADANVDAAKITADGNKRLAIATGVKDQEKEQGKLQKDIYDNTLKSIDFSGISPTAAHEYATILAKTAGKGYGTISDPGKKLSDAVIHPSLLQAYRPVLEQAKTSDEYQLILNKMMKHGPDAVHLTSISGTARLPRIQQSKNDMIAQAPAAN